MKRPPTTARNKMMDLLAMRDHSEKELRAKLRKKEFSAEQIDQAIAYAKTHGWLPDTHDQQAKLARQFADVLGKKYKGIHFINGYLKQKGLPPVPKDEREELAKAQYLIKRKLTKGTNKSKNDLIKASRFLQARGFDSSTIRMALKQIK